MRPFTYARASTAEEAVRLATANGATARYLAGGTTLVDLMKLGVEAPTYIVDVNALGDLSAFDTSGPDELVFGAMARMSDVAADERLGRDYPLLSEALWRAASQQVRNMASVGGNLLQRTRCEYFRSGEPFACNKRDPGSGCAAQEGINRGHALLGGSDACIAVYPGDWAIALVALDATIDLLGPNGARSMLVEALHREPGTTPHLETTIEAGELIVRIRVPVTTAGRGSTYHKIRDRESYAFALAAAAVALEMRDDTAADVRIALGGVATRPWRAREAEKMLVGKQLTRDEALAAGRSVFRDARTTPQNRFRTELGAQTVADALMIARRRAAIR